MSLEPAAAALQSAATTEDSFQKLYDDGALDTPGEKPAEAAAPADKPVAAASAEVPDAPEAVEDEGPEYASLDEYLTKQNLESASFYELPVTVKVDGKTSQVKLADVLNQYQFSAANTHRAQAIAEQQRTLETERVQAQQFIAGQITSAQALGQLAHRELMGQYNNIDWVNLRATNPAEWAAAQQEFNQRASAIQQHLAQVNEVQRQQALQQQQDVLKALPIEHEKMIEARPEWRDQTKFQESRTQMGAFAKSLGFSDAELNGIFDHRYMLVLDMASRYAALQASGAQAVKRVRAAPISAQPGARIERDPSRVAMTQAKEAVRKNPRDQDAQARLFSRLA